MLFSNENNFIHFSILFRSKNFFFNLKYLFTNSYNFFSLFLLNHKEMDQINYQNEPSLMESQF